MMYAIATTFEAQGLPMRALAVFSISIFALVAIIGECHAQDELDIKAQLSLPGVKLVVVEFFATWCEPCMEAVPKWKALHKKYAAQGLRFIVVSAEGDQTCSQPPDWSPDIALCDQSGLLQKNMDVKKLPTSFLYSWDGAIHLDTLLI